MEGGRYGPNWLKFKMCKNSPKVHRNPAPQDLVHAHQSWAPIYEKSPNRRFRSYFCGEGAQGGGSPPLRAGKPPPTPSGVAQSSPRPHFFDPSLPFPSLCTFLLTFLSTQFRHHFCCMSFSFHFSFCMRLWFPFWHHFNILSVFFFHVPS